MKWLVFYALILTNLCSFACDKKEQPIEEPIIDQKFIRDSLNILGTLPGSIEEIKVYTPEEEREMQLLAYKAKLCQTKYIGRCVIIDNELFLGFPATNGELDTSSQMRPLAKMLANDQGNNNGIKGEITIEDQSFLDALDLTIDTASDDDPSNLETGDFSIKRKLSRSVQTCLGYKANPARFMQDANNNLAVRDATTNLSVCTEVKISERVKIRTSYSREVHGLSFGNDPSNLTLANDPVFDIQPQYMFSISIDTF